MSKFPPTDEQQRVLDFDKKNLIVSASAGSGKTSTLIEFISQLVEKGQPLKRILLLTFTKNASSEMKERLLENLYNANDSENVQSAIDDITTADISTIHAFLERLVKKNVNILPIEDGFSVLGENESEDLKNKAFENAEKKFKQERKDDYNELFFKLDDRNFIFKMLNDMSSFFACQTNPIEKIANYKKSQKEYFDKSIKFIEDLFLPRIKNAIQKLSILKSQLENEKLFSYADEIIKKFNVNKDGIEFLKAVDLIEISRFPTVKNCDTLQLEELKEIVGEIKEIKKELSSISLQNEEVYNREKFGEIENIIYDFYLLFEEEYSSIKQKFNCVDFNDLEKYSALILDNTENLSQIQEEYDYIFVDEYQDTNYVQEKLIKDIAKKSKFVAVGDPKQGIYGFRNATSEIIKNDIKNFSQEENSSAEFLRKNFRSNPDILKFVNSIFVNVMKDDTVGIDYEKTSMLEAGNEKDFVFDEKLPSIIIDVIKQKSEEKKEEFAPVYDILKDDAKKTSSKNLEAKAIATRIEELLLKKIYDNKTKEFRNVTYRDIVILLRGKSELAREIISELSIREIPVISTIKGNFKDYSEILVLINLFKIMLDEKDDVALASVMLSKIGNFSPDELASIRLNHTEKELYKIYQTSVEEKIVKFRELINELRFVFEVKGAYLMLQHLFDKTEFREYISSKQNAENEMFVLESFLSHLKNCPYNNSLSSLVKYLDKDEIAYKGGGNSENAISICTIHASKGLEYPIVILAETGKAILKTNANKYILNNDYGFALQYFSQEEDTVFMTPLVYMLKTIEKNKNRVDEMMLLYVALTRAKNMLYISGSISSKDNIYVANPFEAKSFLSLILSANKDLRLEKKEILEEKRISLNIIDAVEDCFLMPNDFVSQSDKNICQKLNEYFDYKYPFEKSTKIVYKNSVSEINNERKEIIKTNFGGDSEAIDRGNAYHLALKLLDFEKINDIKTLEEEIEKREELIEAKKLISFDILFKNIILLKSVLPKNGKIFKEKEFTSKINLKEINADEENEEIMIQGAVDLFAIGEKNVLIDYKFSNDSDEKSLKNRYKMQLFLYKNAIEKAYNIQINDVFLLSLKYAKLINF